MLVICVNIGDVLFFIKKCLHALRYHTFYYIITNSVPSILYRIFSFLLDAL